MRYELCLTEWSSSIYKTFQKVRSISFSSLTTIVIFTVFYLTIKQFISLSAICYELKILELVKRKNLILGLIQENLIENFIQDSLPYILNPHGLCQLLLTYPKQPCISLKINICYTYCMTSSFQNCHIQVHLSRNNVPVVKPPPNHTSLPSTTATFLATRLIAVLQPSGYSVFHGGDTPIQLSLP